MSQILTDFSFGAKSVKIIKSVAKLCGKNKTTHLNK